MALNILEPVGDIRWGSRVADAPAGHGKGF